MSGEGAYTWGGRWNSPGQYVVYTSGNLSLATLELLVHLGEATEVAGLRYVYHDVRFSSDAMAVLAEASLPAGWDSQPETRVSQNIGDDWLDSQVSVVLAVPSVLTPKPLRFELEYMNYLVNPLHPDLENSVEVGTVHDLELDSRLR